MFRRQLIVQEGLMAMPLHKLLGRAFLVNLVGTAGMLLAGSLVASRMKKNKTEPVEEDL